MFPLITAEAFEHMIAKQISERLGKPDESTFVGRFDQLCQMEEAIRAELRPVEEVLESYEVVLDKMFRRLAVSYIEHQLEQKPGQQLNTFAKGTPSFAFGRKVWTEVHRRRENAVILAVRRGDVSWSRRLEPELRHGALLDERVVELPLALEVADFASPGTILDAGASLNLSFLRQLAPDPVARITHFTQSGEKEDAAFDGDRVSYQFGDLRDIEFKTGTFDRVVCVSTLEHIGMDNTHYAGRAERRRWTQERNPESYLDAFRELVRVLRPGGRLMVSFPYGRARDHGSYQVFGPAAVAQMRGVVEPHRLRMRYFRYDGFWYEAPDDGSTEEVPAPSRGGEAVTGLAVMLVEKRPRPKRDAAPAAERASESSP